MKHRNKKISVVDTVLLCLLMLAVVAPFYIMLVGAFKPNTSLIAVPADLLPFRDCTLKNLKTVFEKSQVFLWFKNSLLISLGVALLTALISVTAGYAFGKMRFRGKQILFMLVMATMIMPKQVLLIPNFLVANDLGLVDKMIGVILTSLSPAFGIFLCRQYVLSLPSELFDAAEIDGCDEFRKYIHVALPLTLPALGTVLIFAFFTTFNDYLWQLVMISDKNLKTLPIGVAMFAQTQLNNKAVQLALALCATVPLAVLFVACQKFFIKGATSGAVKG